MCERRWKRLEQQHTLEAVQGAFTPRWRFEWVFLSVPLHQLISTSFPLPLSLLLVHPPFICHFFCYSSSGVALGGGGRNRKSEIEITPHWRLLLSPAYPAVRGWREKRQNMRQINVWKTHSKMADAVRASAALVCHKSRLLLNSNKHSQTQRSQKKQGRSKGGGEVEQGEGRGDV